MKVKIHEFFEDHELTDGQILFANLLMMCHFYEGPKAEFYMASLDVQILLNQRCANPRMEAMLPFVEHFTIAEWSSDVWSFKLKNECSNRQGSPNTIWRELKSPRAIAHYHYMLGRLTPWEKGTTQHTGITDFQIKKGHRSLPYFLLDQIEYTI